MTRDELERFVELFSDMGKYNEELSAFLVTLIEKYAPEHDLGQALTDPSVISDIFAQTDDSLLDYFEEQCFSKNTGFLFTFLSEDRQIRILENPRGLSGDDLELIVRNLSSNELKERYIDLEALSLHNKEEIIVSIEGNDELKYRLMQKVNGISLTYKKRIIGSISDEEILLKCLEDIDELDSKYISQVIITKINNSETRLRAIKELLNRLDSADIVSIINTAENMSEAIPFLIQSIEGLDPFFKAEIILSIEDDDKKIKVMKELEDLDSYDRNRIIRSIEDDDKKIELIQSIQDLDSYSKIEIVRSIEDDDKKIEAMQVIGDIGYYSKGKIICSIKDDDKKIEAMKKLEDLDSRDIVEIICSIKDDNKRIELMQSIEEINSSDKASIIRSIEDDDKKIEVLQSIEGLDSYHKASIIRSIEDDNKRIELMQSIEGINSSDKASIICSIEDDNKRIELMQSIEGINSSDKASIIRSIEDDNKKIELMQSIEGINSSDKASIIRSIEDDDKKIEVLKNTEDLGTYEKVDIINTLEPEKVRELIISSSIPSNVWTVYRKRNNTSIDFIKDNIEIFIKAENIEITDIETTKNTLLKMCETNSDVLKTIDFRILQQKYIDTLGEDRINLISCYSEMQKDVLNLSDEQLYLFDKCLDVYIEQNETDEWTVLAQDLLTHIGEYDTLVQSIENAEDLSIQDITALSRIMQGENWCEIDSIEDVRDYDRIKAEKCQAIMEDENVTLEEKRQAVFQKIFGHDTSYAESMIIKYGEDIENIDECDMKDYIRSIKLISEIEDADVLQEIFEQCEYAELDKVSAERELKTAYFEQFLDDLYEPKEEDRQDGTNNVYEVGTNFKILMTSVGAYFNAGKTEDFKSDWNRPAISTQHFCASYIRNDMIGTAPIRKICYGFSSMREDGLMLSGSSDIYSSANTAVSTARHGERYYTPNVQIDKTISYNEMDIRRIQGGIKVQPDYIIVFRKNGQIDNMEEAQRASEQWDGMPIIVIDVDKCLEAERSKVDMMLTQYRESPTPELAREITQKVRNNRVTDRGFCSDIETELSQLRTEVEFEQSKTSEVHPESKEESHTEEIEAVDEEQLAENYESVSAEEREQGVSKIREIYRKVKEISKGGKDDGR